MQNTFILYAFYSCSRLEWLRAHTVSIISTIHLDGRLVGLLLLCRLVGRRVGLLMVADRHDPPAEPCTQIEVARVQSLSTLQERLFVGPPAEDVGGVGAGGVLEIPHDEGVPLRRILSSA